MDTEKNEVLAEEAVETAAEAVEETAAEIVEEAAEAAEEAVEEAAPAEQAEETAPQAEAPAADRDAAQQRPQRPANRQRRRKVCMFCTEGIDHIDYKDTVRLRKCVSERSKILPRRITGTCARHQRQLTVAIKRARHMALIPYISD